MTVTPSNYQRRVLLDPSLTVSGTTYPNQYIEFVGAYVDPKNPSTIYVVVNRGDGPQTASTFPRTRAPAACSTAEGQSTSSRRDWWGLDNYHHTLASADHGVTFGTWAFDETDLFTSSQADANGRTTGLFIASTVHPQAHIKLNNGDILRRINWEDDCFDASHNATAYLQRLPASQDGSPRNNSSGAIAWQEGGPSGSRSNWGYPESDVVQVSRMRYLNDGVTLMAIGEDFQQTAGSGAIVRSGIDYVKPLLAVSTDEGFDWANAMVLPSNWGSKAAPNHTNITPGRFYPNEGDFVQLANGDILMIWRSGWSDNTTNWGGVTGGISWAGTNADKTHVGFVQCKLTKDATTPNLWHYTQPIVWNKAEQAGTDPSGTFGAGPIHPELLRVKTGDRYVIFFFTRNWNNTSPHAFYYTEDEGVTWKQLFTTLPSDLTSSGDPYYPRSVVTYRNNGNGTETPIVHIFSHVGGDDAPGDSNMQLIYRSFELPTNTVGGTGGTAPAATSSAADGISTTAATLHGTVNPDGLATTYHFEYGTTTAYGTSTGTVSAGSGTTALAESAALSGLSPGTTYHFRLVATNSAGTSNGADQAFTTTALLAPVVVTGGADGIDTTHATLHGTVNAEGQPTTYHFDYGTTTGYGSSTTALSAGSASSAVAESAALSGLAPNTTYHFRLVAVNGAGTTNGADQTFATPATPPPTPVVATEQATAITLSQATLHGSVNPNGAATTYHFEYGLTTAYGTSTTSASAGSGSVAVEETAALTSLAAATTYHFRVVATNASGTTNGSDQTFTTQAPVQVKRLVKLGGQVVDLLG